MGCDASGIFFKTRVSVSGVLSGSRTRGLECVHVCLCAGCIVRDVLGCLQCSRLLAVC